MNPDDELYFQELETRKRALELENANLRNDQMGHTSIFSGADNTNLVQYQLDLSEEKEKIDHLLRGHIIKVGKDGREYWDEPDDPTSKSLTNYGVERLMNIINFYLSRNIILSNYDKQTIAEKMKDLGWEIADAIFLEYEYLFYKPNYAELIKRDADKIAKVFEEYEEDEDKLALEIYGLVEEYQEEIERTYKKNCKQYPIIVRLLIDSIHSAYNRALGGEERTSLRRVMSVSQTQSSSTPMKANVQQKKAWSPMSWIRG